jgi:hypothetical protein
MISPYQSIIEYQDNDWQDFLDRYMLLDIFMPVLQKYGNPADAKVIIKYIVYAYSVQSDKIHLGVDWLANKKKIFEYVMAKPVKGIYEALVHLQCEAVLQSVRNWVDYQENEVFTQLQVMRDLKVEMQISSGTKILKSSGEVDYDQKAKNIEHALSLRDKIKELEAELIQNNPKLKEAVREIRQTKTKVNIGPEHFSK